MQTYLNRLCGKPQLGKLLNRLIFAACLLAYSCLVTAAALNTVHKLMLCLSFIPLSLFSAAVHELGHLCLALLSRAQLIRFAVFGAELRLYRGRIKFRFSPKACAAPAQCLMLPSGSAVPYLIGGVAFNLILMLLSLLALRVCAAPVLRLLLYGLCAANLSKALINGIPAYFGDAPNDAASALIALLRPEFMRSYLRCIFDFANGNAVSDYALRVCQSHCDAYLRPYLLDLEYMLKQKSTGSPS